MSSALRAVETAYRIDLPADEWLQGMGESVLRLAGGGEDIVAFLFDASRDSAPVDLGPLWASGPGSPQLCEHSRSFHRHMTGSAYRLIFRGPGRPSINGLVTERLRTLGLEPAAFPPLVDLLRRLAVPELWSLWATVDGREGVGFVQPLAKPTRDELRPRGWWDRLGTHVAAGYRARRALAGASPLETAAGVFRPDGTPVRVPRAHEHNIDTWRRIVRTIDRARAAEFRKAEGDILNIWNGIIDGRWSLFDHIDTDGRRYVVLVETGAPSPQARRSLSSRESEVCLLAAEGLTNKEIAYELGLSLSSVATLLRRSLSKLGIPDRRRLQRFGPLVRRLRSRQEPWAPHSPEGSTPETA
jgi:DNA-binding CsgD family transcriptional regulator